MDVQRVYELSGIGVFIIVAATFYFSYLRPHLRLQRKLTERLLGNDGTDGLPREESIFWKMDGLSQHLTRQDITLAALAAEFPKNGIPTRAAVDAIAKDVRAMRVLERKRWKALAVALAEQKIATPPLMEDDE